MFEWADTAEAIILNRRASALLDQWAAVFSNPQSVFSNVWVSRTKVAKSHDNSAMAAVCFMLAL